MSDRLLDVRELSVKFRGTRHTAVAVDRLSLHVGRGEVLGIVGESGSGKTVSMMSMLGLLRGPNVSVTGSVMYAGLDLLSLSDDRMRKIRGRDIAVIFQDPMTALTPVYTVGWQIVEQIRAHERVTKRAARARAIELLKEVGIPAPERRVDAYPHELSGGMRQRAMIAMAISCEPQLLIADEPTTALDVTTQAQVLRLLLRLQQSRGAAVILITHDIGVVSWMADRIAVMYGGRMVEAGTRREVLDDPQHPYTWGLLDAVPRLGGRRRGRLSAIPGLPVSAADVTDGCRFAPRCALRFERCCEVPSLSGTGADPSHRDACWLPRDGRARRRARMRGEGPLSGDEDLSVDQA